MSAIAYDTLPPGQLGDLEPVAQDGAAENGHAAQAVDLTGVESRVFRGRSIEELIPRIQVELGSDAIILRRRTGLSGGFAGFFQRQFVEIEARAGTPRVDMYDEDEDPAAPVTGPPAPAAPEAQRGAPEPPPAAPHPPATPPPLPPAASNWVASRATSAYAATGSLSLADPAGDSPALSHYEHVRLRAAQGSEVRAQGKGANKQTGSRPASPRPKAVADAPVQATDSAQQQPAAVPEQAAAAPPRARAGAKKRAAATAPRQAAKSRSAAKAGRRGTAAPKAEALEQPPSPASAPEQPASTQAPAHEPAQRESSDQPALHVPATPVSAQDADINGFRELTPESLLGGFESLPGEAPPRNGTPPVAPRDGDSFAAALADAETALPRPSVESRLLGLGVGEELVAELLRTADSELLPMLTESVSLADAVRMVLRMRIPQGVGAPVAGSAIAFVGPGGSGKSACVSALARELHDDGSLAVACATVLADEQGHSIVLEPHLGEPTSITDPRALQALRSVREEGAVLLLDMPPVSPGNRDAVYTLAALLDVLGPDRVVLTLPATLGATPTAQLVHGLRPLGANALAITHADETDQLGVAVASACAFGLAPEYLLDCGHGASDLVPIDPIYLANRLLTTADPSRSPDDGETSI